MNKKWTLLFFDDQPDNTECMADLLNDKFEVIGCNRVDQYSEFLNNHKPHAILLDVHMPIMDGYELFTKIVEHPMYNGCPIMFISGDYSDENKLKSHNCGGIDFFTRDIPAEELMIRIISKVRLYLQTSLSLSIGNVRIDFENLKVYLGNSSLDLTLIELRILGAIFRSYPTTLNRKDLIRKVWGEENVKPGSVDVHLSSLRPKLKHWDHVVKMRGEKILVEVNSLVE